VLLQSILLSQLREFTLLLPFAADVHSWFALLLLFAAVVLTWFMLLLHLLSRSCCYISRLVRSAAAAYC
jgi:hypothetical protein